MSDGNKLTTLSMLAIFTGACLLSLTFPAKAAFMPLLVAIPGMIMCAAQLAIDLIHTPVQPKEKTAKSIGVRPAEGARSEAEVFIWLALFAAVILGFGFVIGGPLIVSLFVRISARESWRNALFAGLGTLAVIQGVFVWFLEVSLFGGIVPEMLLA